MVRIRMEEEGLSAVDACDAVLRDNLHGLEIDQRCTQIAAFALAFAAWTFPEAGGYRELPKLHVACTGIAPQATEEQWIKLAEESGLPMPRGGAEPVEDGLRNLHRLFSQASTLGSLIDPADLPADLIAADYETVHPYLAAILSAETADDDVRERAVAAAGMAKAADLLARDYTLVITNVPYLARGKQDDVLRAHLGGHFGKGKADLATAFILRCLDLCAKCGAASLVTPQNWLFLAAYRGLREKLLDTREWNAVARLGAGAFETISGHVVNVALISLSARTPARDQAIGCLDAAPAKEAWGKAALLRSDGGASIVVIPQEQQRRNPDARISAELEERGDLLTTFASTGTGMQTFDLPRFVFKLWEVQSWGTTWLPSQSTVSATTMYGGVNDVVRWERGRGQLFSYMEDLARQGYRSGIWKAGSQFWGLSGIVVSLMNDLPTSLYLGIPFNQNAGVLVPTDQSLVDALWCFSECGELSRSVRAIDQSLKVTNGTVGKIAFNPEHWREVAAKKYPNGLPEPESDDPTEWLFHGRPDGAQEGMEMHVGAARLLGYRWPAELDNEMRLSERARALVKRCDALLPFADSDGIVCIPAVAAESSGADRLQALLAACGVKPTEDLDTWLRDKFFQEHCQLFHQRPFVWHIWDGRRKDGFHALVNYHELDRKLLEKLIYGHLGDWISRQQGAERRGESGAEARRMAAEDLQQRLKLILEGEPPYDIFVRWKPLEEQPIGWAPDLNDGVRLNIRPFVTAGVLRKNPKIKWKKDRGKEPERPKDQSPWFWG